MADDGSPDRLTDCVVVGGGLAGLACAEGLVRRGRSVHVLEAGEAVGGRARTVWHRGRPVERGFQTVFAAYPQTRRLVRSVGIPRRDLRAFSGGAVFADGVRTHRLGVGPAALARFSGLSPADRARLAALGARVVPRSGTELLDGQAERTSDEYLRALGLSSEGIERVMRPLFGVIFLDRALGADEAYLRFLVSMLGRGPAVLPSDGLGMIAEWTAAAVRAAGARVETGAEAVAFEVEATGRRVTAVRLADGRAVRGRQVVLATEAPATARLLEPHDPATAARLPVDAASSVTAAFALRRPLYRGRAIVLNATGEDGPDRVDVLCQSTNVTRSGAVDGPHVLLATRVTTGGRSEDGVVEATEALVRRLTPGYSWRGNVDPIGVFVHRFAQFRPLPGVRASLPGPRTALDNLLLAGDLTHHPSIEGAVASGRRAAGIADALIP